MKVTLSILFALATLTACNNKPSMSTTASKKLQSLPDNWGYFKFENQVKLYNDSLGDICTLKEINATAA